MKLLVFLIICFCLAIPINGQKSNPIKDDDEIANECFDKFFDSLDIIAKHYKYRAVENSRSRALVGQGVDYKETLYEYRQVQDVRMRMDISSNQTIYDSDRKFHPYSKEFDITRSLFDRFHYKFKERRQTSDGTVIVMSFVPKQHLEEKHRFDRTINALVGEIEMRESDMALLVFRAHLPEDVNVVYGRPPTAGVVVTSASVVFETEQFGTLVVPKSANLVVNYYSQFFTRKLENYVIRENKYQDYEKLETLSETAQDISWNVSNDHEISDSIWTKKKWFLCFSILIGVPTLLIWLLLKIRKARASR